MSKYISVRHKDGTYCDLLFGSEFLWTFEHYTDGEFVETKLESLRNELALAQQTIADYQERNEALIQSGIDADNALELVNEQLVESEIIFEELPYEWVVARREKNLKEDALNKLKLSQAKNEQLLKMGVESEADYRKQYNEKKKVWLVMQNIDYEGSNFVALTSTFQKAKKAAHEHANEYDERTLEYHQGSSGHYISDDNGGSMYIISKEKIN